MENTAGAFDEVFAQFLARNEAGDALQCVGLLKLYVQNRGVKKIADLRVCTYSTNFESA